MPVIAYGRIGERSRRRPRRTRRGTAQTAGAR